MLLNTKCIRSLFTQERRLEYFNNYGTKLVNLHSFRLRFLELLSTSKVRRLALLYTKY